MKQAQGITEQLKAENILEWMQIMNNIQAYAREKSLPLFVEDIIHTSFLDIIRLNEHNKPTNDMEVCNV